MVPLPNVLVGTAMLFYLRPVILLHRHNVVGVQRGAALFLGLILAITILALVDHGFAIVRMCLEIVKCPRLDRCPVAAGKPQDAEHSERYRDPHCDLPALSEVIEAM